MVEQGSAPEGVANEHSWSNSPPDDHHDHHRNDHRMSGLWGTSGMVAVAIFSSSLHDLNFEVEDGDGNVEVEGEKAEPVCPLHCPLPSVHWRVDKLVSVSSLSCLSGSLPAWHPISPKSPLPSHPIYVLLTNPHPDHLLGCAKSHWSSIDNPCNRRYTGSLHDMKVKSQCVGEPEYQKSKSKNPSILYVTNVTRVTWVRKFPKLQHVTYVTHVTGISRTYFLKI